MNDDNDYDPDNDLDISPESHVDGMGSYNEDHDPLALMQRKIASDT